jgi:hypothetical protein
MRPTHQRGKRIATGEKNPLARHTPAGRKTTATGRSPGLRVIAWRYLPGPKIQWLARAKTRRSQLRGQPGHYTRIPVFILFRETYRPPSVKGRQWHGQSGGFFGSDTCARRRAFG